MIKKWLLRRIHDDALAKEVEERVHRTEEVTEELRNLNWQNGFGLLFSDINPPRKGSRPWLSG